MTSPLTRVVRQAGGAEILDRLARLSGADLTTLLLAVMRRRAARLTPAEVFRRYREDRFTVPGEVPYAEVRAVEDRLMSLVPQGFRPVVLSPVAPLGLHSVVGPVHQDKVLSTVRGNEVAADPTNGLALVAAIERQGVGSRPGLGSRGRQGDGSRVGSGAGQGRGSGARQDVGPGAQQSVGPRTTEPVRLAAAQRVVRAQVFGPGMAAHFGLFGMVTAGRDTGDLAFEREHIVEHLRYVAAVPPVPIELRLTVWDKRYQPIADAVRAALPHVAITDDPHRESGREYYTGFAYSAWVNGANLADGGFTDWTQRLLADRKERLLTTGIGIDRLAALVGPLT